MSCPNAGRCFSYNLLIIILLFSSSGCSKSSVQKNISDFFDDLDKELLNKAMVKQLEELKAKKTVFGQKLNAPDSMHFFFSDPGLKNKFQEKCEAGISFFQVRSYDSLGILNGLEADFYNFREIEKMLTGLYQGRWKKKPERYADSAAALMILTADALSAVYSDLGKGRVDPGFSGDLFYIKRRSCKGRIAFLQSENYMALADSALPRNKYYQTLQKEYAQFLKYKDSVKGSVRLNEGLRTGDVPDRNMLKNLCYRLKMRNCMDQPDSIISKLRKVPRFVFYALKTFQELSLLEATGKPDKATLDKLNFDVTDCQNRLKLSMERLRWYEINNSPQGIFVNIASNTLFGFRNDSLVIEMKVCSGEAKGKAYYDQLEKSKKKGKSHLAPVSHETPVIQSEISYFTVNPKWNVPHNILIKEMLGMVRNNPSTLMRMGYTLKSNKGETIDPESINWKEFNPSKPGFRLVQKPGDGNALGKLIIHFNNPYSIYMHDTPSKWAFGSANRNVSHGCIRLEKPFDLLEYLSTLDDKKKWLDKALMTAGLPPKDTALLRKWKKEKEDTAVQKEFIADKSTGLQKKIPVNILYLTAYPYKNGFVRYAGDPYAEDAALMQAMKL